MTACQNTPKTPALDMANFDLSVAPNADFYEYATGGWQKNNPLKPEYARYGSFDILRDNNEKRINELFSGMTQQKAEPGSVKQKISDLYKMGLDSVRLNAEGAAPIKAAVDGILAIGDRSQLTAAVARLHSSIANPFFGVGVQSDLMNSDINALYASQPDLIMGDRDYYLDPDSIYTKQLRQNGELITHNKDESVFVFLRLDDLIQDDGVYIHPSQTLGDIVQIMSRERHDDYFPVLDNEKHLLGIVRLNDVREDLFNPQKYGNPITRYMLLSPDTILQHEQIQSVLRRFDENHVWVLPVVDKEKHYLGYISKSRIMTAYREQLVKISQ